MISENHIRLFMHFYNQLLPLLGNNKKEIRKKLRYLKDDPFYDTKGLDTVTEADFNEFLDIYQQGADVKDITSSGEMLNEELSGYRGAGKNTNKDRMLPWSFEKSYKLIAPSDD